MRRRTARTTGTTRRRTDRTPLRHGALRGRHQRTGEGARGGGTTYDPCGHAADHARHHPAYRHPALTGHATGDRDRARHHAGRRTAACAHRTAHRLGGGADDLTPRRRGHARDRRQGATQRQAGDQRRGGIDLVLVQAVDHFVVGLELVGAIGEQASCSAGQAADQLRLRQRNHARDRCDRACDAADAAGDAAGDAAQAAEEFVGVAGIERVGDHFVRGVEFVAFVEIVALVVFVGFVVGFELVAFVVFVGFVVGLELVAFVELVVFVGAEQTAEDVAEPAERTAAAATAGSASRTAAAPATAAAEQTADAAGDGAEELIVALVELVVGVELVLERVGATGGTLGAVVHQVVQRVVFIAFHDGFLLLRCGWSGARGPAPIAAGSSVRRVRGARSGVPSRG